MQSIIDEYRQALGQDDLYRMWQEELRLRILLRGGGASPPDIKIETHEELQFIKRAFYFHDRKNDYFAILFSNMHNVMVQAYLLACSPLQVIEFLQYIAGELARRQPLAKNMQFLINIYRPEYHDYFTPLVDLLDNSTCNYLLARTANKNLRQMLKSRQAAIAAGKSGPTPAEDNYPTIFGDKINIIRQLVRQMQAEPIPAEGGLADEGPQPDLTGADLLFKAGLLRDSLAVLAAIAATAPDTYVAIYKQLAQQVHRTVPFFSIIVNPLEPGQYAREVYRRNFPGIVPDQAALYYLDIYKTSIGARQGFNKYAMMEISQLAGRIAKFRPLDDIPVLLAGLWPNPVNFDPGALLDRAAARLPVSPHESLAAMQVLRLAHHEGAVNLTREMTDNLLSLYRELFWWIPDPFFINQELVAELGPSASGPLHEEIENLSGLVKAEQIEPVQTPGTDNSRLRIFLGRYMGVN